MRARRQARAITHAEHHRADYGPADGRPDAESEPIAHQRADIESVAEYQQQPRRRRHQPPALQLSYPATRSIAVSVCDYEFASIERGPA